ncbi:MAG: TetR/AcrR family transcriptional regulator [Anaerolineales bacterium]
MGKGEQTKADIIQKAAVLFNQKGYDGAAISDVMEATGLEKGGIYRHFESKQELALEAFEYAVRLANARYLAAIRHSHNALDRLRAIVLTFAELQNEVPIKGGCPVMNTAIDSDDAHPALRERAQDALEAWQAILTQVIERGIERGQISGRVDARATATRLIALMEGGLMMSRLTDDERHMAAALDGLNAWIDGLAVRSTEQPASP